MVDSNPKECGKLAGEFLGLPGVAVGHGDKAAVVLMAPLMPQAGKAGCRSKLSTSFPLASGAVCSWRSSLPSNKMEQVIHPDIIVTSLSVRVLFYFFIFSLYAT